MLDNFTISYSVTLDDENYNNNKTLINYLGSDFINIANSNISVEEFLAYIKNAEKFVTDSFHGTCFAILFNIPFFTISNEKRGNSRFESLFKTFGIGFDNLSNIPNWGNINKIILSERIKGIEWLKNNLAKDTNNTLYREFAYKLIKIKSKLNSLLK